MYDKEISSAEYSLKLLVSTSISMRVPLDIQV